MSEKELNDRAESLIAFYDEQFNRLDGQKKTIDEIAVMCLGKKDSAMIYAVGQAIHLAALTDTAQDEEISTVRQVLSVLSALVIAAYYEGRNSVTQ